MTLLNEKRIVWTAEQKIMFVVLLRTPNKFNKFISVTKIANDYNISKKTIYEWIKIYDREGANGFKPIAKSTDRAKSNDPQLIAEICEIALHNPDLSSAKIIKCLKHFKSSVSIPTVQKILAKCNLETLDKRFAATELAIVNQKISLPSHQLEKLIKRNPCFVLTTLSWIKKAPFLLLETISLNKYLESNVGFILLATDMNTLYTYAQLWDGQNPDELFNFLISTQTNLKAHTNNKIFFSVKLKGPFRNFNFNYYDSQKHGEILLGEHKPRDKYLEFFNPISATIKILKRYFISNYTLISKDRFELDLQNWLTKFNTESGAIGYPTFGKSPLVCFQELGGIDD